MIGALAMTRPSRPVAEPVNVVVVPETTVNAVDGAIEIATGVLSGAVVEPESPPQPAAVSASPNTKMIERGTCKGNVGGGLWTGQSRVWRREWAEELKA
jgi:hypothetical protein